jgi:hypothetical protein
MPREQRRFLVAVDTFIQIRSRGFCPGLAATGWTLISFAICRFPAADLATSAALFLASSECTDPAERDGVLVRHHRLASCGHRQRRLCSRAYDRQIR